MNMKRKIVWLLIVIILLAACGGTQAEGEQTAVSPPASAQTADEAPPPTATAVAPTTVPERDDAETASTSESTLSPTDLQGLSAEDKAVRLLTNETAVAEFLDGYPDWNADTWPEDEENGIWGVSFYSEAADEWLGEGTVNINTGDILDYFIPRELSPEEFQAGLTEVETLVLNDAGVLARLGDPAVWEHETDYDRWEEMWYVWFWHGLDELAVSVYRDEEGVYLDEIFDPAQLEAEKEAEWQRDQAVELAWSAEGIDQALDGVDNWQTLVAPQGDLWAVSFVADDQELFFALVDINNQTIVETK